MDTTTSTTTSGYEPPEQLSLLPASSAPLRFRLDAETRRRGLIHVARMRALLAERRALRETSERAA